jgi:hypothetical protein
MGCVDMGDIATLFVLENIEVDEEHFFIVVDLSLVPYSIYCGRLT